MRILLQNRKNFGITLMVISLFFNLPGGFSQIVDKPGEETLTVEAVLDSLIQRFNKVEDYTVRVKVSVKMPRFRMPNKTVKLFFKQPDKIKIEANGFAVVPKTGLTTSPERIFNNMFDLFVSGLEEDNDRTYWIIEGIVKADSLKLPLLVDNRDQENDIISRFWIDAEDWVITKTETYLDTMKVFSVRTSYEEVETDMVLPLLTELRFNIVGEFFESMENHVPQDPDAGSPLKEVDVRGLVRLEFSRYKINRGLKDKIFEDTTF